MPGNVPSNVLVHTVGPNTSASTNICEVVNCRRDATKRCGTKSCLRYLCNEHNPKGGHKAHQKSKFKPAAIEPAIATDFGVGEVASEPTGNDNSTTDEGTTVCQVIECNGEAKHRCVLINCPFTAVCDLHNMNGHTSHLKQTHTDASKRSKTI